MSASVQILKYNNNNNIRLIVADGSPKLLQQQQSLLLIDTESEYVCLVLPFSAISNTQLTTNEIMSYRDREKNANKYFHSLRGHNSKNSFSSASLSLYPLIDLVEQNTKQKTERE